jgi:predicted ABC-class ATPase
MRPIQTLKKHLEGLDGKDYGTYQSLIGSYSYPQFDLLIDQIPKDPYAPPHTGIYRVRVLRNLAEFPEDMFESEIRRIASCDYLTRQIYHNCQRYSSRRGTGNSGIITISKPNQEVLVRTSVAIDSTHIEARIFLGLPASNRIIRSEIAAKMIFDELPWIVQSSLFSATTDLDAMYHHLYTTEDSEFLRRWLFSSGLIAFIADGSVLPRMSGVDPRPFDSDQLVRFQSPENLRVKIDLPNAGAISGLGIPKGVTLLVGGGYHGKSTLLQALEQGVYNHIAGDGREFCVSLPETVKIRAYSGRYIVNTDISPFIKNIPLQKDTRSFSTLNASGSTSQAAYISEAIECGAKVLLMDEDTCATNFLIRDYRMQQLVRKEYEPITAFIDKIRQLYQQHDISSILVLGGAGDYLEVADHIIQLIEFVPHDVTEQAFNIVKENPSGRMQEGEQSFDLPGERVPEPVGLDTLNEHGHRRIYAPNPHELVYGRMKVDLTDVEQLLEPAQTKAIGLAIEYGKKYMDGKATLRTVVEKIMFDISKEGLDLLDRKYTGDLAAFRGLELAAVLNRMRDFQSHQLSHFFEAG